jgi:multidrug efflux system outer membrane protein
VSNVAAAYFQLVELDRELAIARESSNTYSQTLTYFMRRYRGGTDTKLSTSRAEANLDSSQATIAVLERQIAQQEDLISVLLGSTPQAIERVSLNAQTIAQTPPGLTTHLLKRRPDIRQAEQSMIGNMLKTNFSVWNIAGNITGPLFQGGRLYQTYRAQKAYWDETVAQYQSTIVYAFRDVSDALVAEEKLKQQRAALEKQVAALRDAVRLSLDRYNIGLSNYFEVLDAEQQLYPAEDALAQTERDQLLAVVSLYKALGGGWALADNEWVGKR